MWLWFPQFILEHMKYHKIWHGKVCGIGYSCNLVNCRSLPTVRRFLLTKCCESSYLTLVFITLPRTDWLMIVTEINKVVRKCVCWVRLGSSIWNVLWLWHTNKDFKSKFIKQLGSSPITSLNNKGKKKELKCIQLYYLTIWTQEERRRTLDLQTLDLQEHCIVYLFELSYIHTPFAIASHH